MTKADIKHIATDAVRHLDGTATFTFTYMTLTSENGVKRGRCGRFVLETSEQRPCRGISVSRISYLCQRDILLEWVGGFNCVSDLIRNRQVKKCSSRMTHAGFILVDMWAHFLHRYIYKYSSLREICG